ncbi:hypothetical protein [Subtercola boreus]|uniref:hypothetical protein n=1 Tax=Subtercola boreus TaxID=120213 RepID=UPI001476B0C8|nr:hypothetical protein [Subtercola boreus]
MPIGHYAQVSYTSAAETAAILDKAGVAFAPPAAAPVTPEEPLVVPALTPAAQRA